MFQSASEVAYTELLKCPQLRPVKPQGAMYMMVQIKVYTVTWYGKE